jgi:hypothetical protein
MHHVTITRKAVTPSLQNLQTRCKWTGVEILSVSETPNNGKMLPKSDNFCNYPKIDSVLCSILKSKKTLAQNPKTRLLMSDNDSNSCKNGRVPTNSVDGPTCHCHQQDRLCIKSQSKRLNLAPNNINYSPPRSSGGTTWALVRHEVIVMQIKQHSDRPSRTFMSSTTVVYLCAHLRVQSMNDRIFTLL